MLVLASYDGLANDCVVCSGIRDDTKVLYLHDPNEWVAYGPRDKLKAKKQWAKLDKSIADLDDKAFVEWNVLYMEVFSKFSADLAEAAGLPDGPSTFEFLLSWVGQVTFLTWQLVLLVPPFTLLELGDAGVASLASRWVWRPDAHGYCLP